MTWRKDFSGQFALPLPIWVSQLKLSRNKWVKASISKQMHNTCCVSTFMRLLHFCSFSSHSIGFPCPGNYNPADFFIRTLTVNPTEYEQSIERIKVSFLVNNIRPIKSTCYIIMFLWIFNGSVTHHSLLWISNSLVLFISLFMIIFHSSMFVTNIEKLKYVQEQEVL